MTLIRFAAILAFFSSILLSAACGGKNVGNVALNQPSNIAVDNSNSSKSNGEELGLLINVPFDTEDVVWKEDSFNKRLVAVLRFSKMDSDKLVADAEKIAPPQPVVLPSETWFPPELIAQSENNGDDNLKGTAYAANKFFQTPYTEGKITRIENTEYFVLELSAK